MDNNEVVTEEVVEQKPKPTRKTATTTKKVEDKSDEWRVWFIIKFNI